MKNPLKKLRLWTRIQWLAAGVTFLMCASDTYTIRELFRNLLDGDTDIWV